MLGRRRAVIIIPEWSLNSGWMDIATKLKVFYNAKAQIAVNTTHMKTEEGLYSDAVTHELLFANLKPKSDFVTVQFIQLRKFSTIMVIMGGYLSAIGIVHLLCSALIVLFKDFA